MHVLPLSIIALVAMHLSGCKDDDKQTTALEVTATAYTSTHSQTDKTPYLAAWNNVLKPGVKSIAVSRDLLKKGLKNGSKVTIEGLPGEYLVLDKMHKRWQNKIDIYMGNDHDKAKKWGKKTVTIRWRENSLE
ncbi:lipoprotein [Thiomicrorhabdus immobilis]|uniref:Lipoprotein n=1 Tax=Thiomicrorhabdus immobilis TaxID=2791037 RepID=A0ABM7MFH4_9GAMM|nr:3D domain-containing protein [Thiomicrorhabdus immobilis]BCN94242.1 lipoprotein [Thiomicrorhabdus immobilis]